MKTVLRTIARYYSSTTSKLNSAQQLGIKMEKCLTLSENVDPCQVKQAAESLVNGQIIAVPTDTIYGIAGLAQDSEAVDRIYNIKQRDTAKPIAISVANVDDIYRWSKVNVPKSLLSDLLPGPVTVVLERSVDLNPNLNPGTRLVGIRIPNHRFMIELAKQCDGPIALTSANVSNTRSSLSVDEFQDLWKHLDLICDEGPLADTNLSRSGSTVVDLSVQGKYKIIRGGSARKPTVTLLEDKYGLEESS